jgi:hypothetical protein
MKTLTLSTLLLVIAIATSSFVLSRQQAGKEATKKILNANVLRAHRQGTGVALTWSTNASADHYKIEHSYDGEYFEPIATVNNNGSSTYKYKDENVFPGTNYYRICFCNSDDVVEETSNIESIRIVSRK